MIVILIMGVLAGICLPKIVPGLRRAARINTCDTNRAMINRKTEEFYHQNGRYPLHLKVVLENPDYFPDDRPGCPFKEPWVMDPAIHRIVPHKH